MNVSLRKWEKEDGDNLSKLLSNKKILLVDDIITTSGSIVACYNLLKGRCKRIEVLVLCYNKRFLL